MKPKPKPRSRSLPHQKLRQAHRAKLLRWDKRTAAAIRLLHEEVAQDKTLHEVRISVYKLHERLEEQRRILGKLLLKLGELGWADDEHSKKKNLLYTKALVKAEFDKAGIAPGSGGVYGPTVHQVFTDQQLKDLAKSLEGQPF